MWREGQEIDEGEENEEISCESEEKVRRERPGVDEREVKMMGDPRRPSQAEVDDHARKNHCPHRNWCGVCVRACGKDLDHRADSDKERGLSEFSFDYCFPGMSLGAS